MLTSSPAHLPRRRPTPFVASPFCWLQSVTKATTDWVRPTDRKCPPPGWRPAVLGQRRGRGPKSRDQHGLQCWQEVMSSDPESHLDLDLVPLLTGGQMYQMEAQLVAPNPPNRSQNSTLSLASGRDPRRQFNGATIG